MSDVMNRDKWAKKILWGSFAFRLNKKEEREITQFLKQVHLLENLSLTHIRALSETLHDRSYEQNEYVFETGQPGAALFIIQSGEIAIEGVDETGAPQTIVTLKEGNFFGELALLDQSPRSASARAVTRTQLLALYRNDLNKMIETNPQVASLIFRSLATVVGERLKATNKILENAHEQAA